MRPDAEMLRATLSDVSTTLGPRPAASPAEQHAAAWVDERLRAAGYTPQRQSFRTSDHLSKRLLPNLLLITAALGAGLVVGRGPRALLGLLSLGLAWQYRHILQGGRPPWDDVLSNETSENIVLRINPARATHQRLVIAAPLDSTVSRFANRPYLRAWVPHVLATAEVTAWSGGLLSLLATDDQRDTATHPWRVGTACFALGLGVLAALDAMGETQHNAANAAELAVLVSLAEALAAQPLQQTEVWLVFSGAGSVAGAGMEAFLQAYAGLLQDAPFVVLDHVGGGELAWVTEHRLSDTIRYSPPAQMHAWATRVAAQLPAAGIMGRALNTTDLTAVIRRHGGSALCLKGYDRASGMPPSDDDYSPDAALKAATFTAALLRDYDRRGGLA
ncbi:MAG: hypothetical protein ACLFTK_01990 [Anaerolineales bacterium]